MYKKILLMILCFLVAMSCSSPSNPDNTNNGDIVNGGDSGNGGGSGNTGDGGSTGDGGNTDIPWTEIAPPLPVLDEEAIKYGIDISQEDSVIKEQIKTKLKEYKNTHGIYKVIFIGTPKEDYYVSASLAKLTLEAAKEIWIQNAIIDVSNVYFNERKIKTRMFRGVNIGYFELSFILPENIIRVIEGNAFSFLNNYLKEIRIPDSVIGINAAAFQLSEVLEKITFTENSQLEYIGELAFSYSKIKEIVIPASVKSIGSSPFGKSLTTVTYLGTSPNAIQHGGDVFPATAKTLILPNVENPKPEEWQNFLGGNFTEVKQK
ncbi:leucine-rich repeat domain-containing protein [Brachyspira pilosicoli]|uniref:leucine-rich repeat domain-containing protein n=1 Tax=Brachyspira pilosicoli TaxID=52584 RepID=UPI0012F51742|nr:leucine-rich repeat domain-containing protein [Brachyspira pilosicoli]